MKLKADFDNILNLENENEKNKCLNIVEYFFVRFLIYDKNQQKKIVGRLSEV